MTQSLNSAPQKQKFSVAINSKMYQNLIASTLRDPARARRFTAAITSAVAVNPALQECDAGTILAGALLGESLNLSPSPQLGQYYLVPFKQKAKYDRGGNMIRPESTTATFVLGYKGYIQLALRSGQYKDLDVMVIKQGEYMGKDPETGKAKFQFIEDDDERETLPTIGYMAYFEYLNGFRKVVYWSKEKMMTHADTFSKAFSRQGYEDLMAGRVPEKDMWRYSSFWYKNFDDMAKKTLLRHIISRWGISKYLNIVQNGRAYSLPGVDPAASMNFDQARSYCEAKGDGWHCMTRMEWGLLMRICEMQGFIPLGNNNYGKHSSEQFYKAIPTFIDTGAGGKTGRTATGTGPLTWYHDNSPSGIADLVGDVWEWAGGVRTVYGELQVMANNNGADAANSQGTSSTKWMAISADDGSYITPDGSGTTANSVKLDIISGHIQWSKAITTRNKDSDWPNCSFAAITCDSTISDAAKLVLQCLGMLPYKSTDLCAKAGHLCYFRNLDAERAFFSGGDWSHSSYGLASFNGNNPRSSARAGLGFRAAFVKLPTA